MPSKTPEQSIIIANDLRTGRSVYLTQDLQWSENASDAEVVASADAANVLDAALNDERANLVIDPYLVAVESNLLATDIRERIRVSGPTIFNESHVSVTKAA